MAARAEPLSIESLLQKQRAEKESASKVRASPPHLSPRRADVGAGQPKFLSKEERAQLAIAARAAELRAAREREEEVRAGRALLEREAEAVRRAEAPRGGSGGGGRCAYGWLVRGAACVLTRGR
jgi:ATP-dependent RNA helicase DDX23/PRP28